MLLALPLEARAQSEGAEPADAEVPEAVAPDLPPPEVTPPPPPPAALSPEMVPAQGAAAQPHAATTHPPSTHPGTPPATADAPRRLGRPFPTPVQPPAPPEDPEVHVTIIPKQDSTVTSDRLRGGAATGETGEGSLGAEGHPGAEPPADE
jgi:hypothetical protein